MRKVKQYRVTIEDLPPTQSSHWIERNWGPGGKPWPRYHVEIWPASTVEAFQSGTFTSTINIVRCEPDDHRIVTREDAENGLKKPPAWWRPHRYSFDRACWELAGPLDPMRWFGEAVLFSIERHCREELGMSPFVPEGCRWTARDFWPAFWRWPL